MNNASIRLHRFLLPALALFVVLGLSPSAQAQRAHLEISGARFRPLPIALAPIAREDDAARQLQATLREDLEVSGLFELLDPKSFLADPKKEGMTAATIDFSKWTAVGADALVKASVTGEANALKVDYRLFDVLAGRELLRRTYTGPATQARSFAHEWADALVEHFTGEPGIFRTRLVFTRRVGDGKQLWVSDFDGRNASRLTTGELDLLPSWSPDGRQVLYTSYRSGSPMLHLVDVASRAVRALPERGDLQTGGAFSPDGKRIALTMSQDGNSDIYVMNADGTGMTALTRTRETESSPVWSPDGKRIAFVSTRSGDPQIFVANADGTGVQRLTFQGRYNQTPDWSPRGDLIAFTARDERNVFDLFVVNVETKKIQRLTQDQGQNEEPSFSPNGRHIVFTSTRTGQKRLWIMNADGTNQRPLAFDGDASTPAWGPWVK